MKKLYFLGIPILLAIIALVVAVPQDLNIVENSLTASGNPGTTVQGQMTIENTGGSTITGISFSATNADITINNFDPEPVDLDPDEQQEITFDIIIPSGLSADDYTETITAESGAETDSVNIVVTVNENPGIDVVESSISLDGTPGNDTNTLTFEIENTGNTDLTNVEISFTADDFQDPSGDQITFTFNPTGPYTINEGLSEVVSVYATIPEDLFLGEYTGTVEVSDGTVSDSFELTVDVESEFIIIDIEDVSEDEPEPGENIDIDVEIDNIGDLDLEDIKVEVKIEDIDDNDDLEEESDEFDLDEGDNEDLTFEFEIPLNVDEGTYNIIVIVDGEDENGDNFEVTQIFMDEIDVQKPEDDEIAIESVSISPETIRCGQSMDIDVRAVNVGTDDQDDMYLEVTLEGVDVVLTSSRFDLDSDDYDDREDTRSFTARIPSDAEEGTYFIGVAAYNEDNDFIRTRELDVQEFIVSGDCESTTSSGDAEIILDTTSMSVDQGDSISISLDIKNNGDDTNDYVLEASGYEDFAILAGIDQPSENIDSGDSSKAFVSLEIDSDTTPGTYTLTLRVKEDGTVLDTETMSITVERDGVTITPTVTGFTSFVDSIFGGGESTSKTVFFVLADLVLVVIIIFFLKMILTKK